MEYIDGEDLASLMKRIGSLTNEKALGIARQLVAGLSVAHERGVLHRDLKPANIMLDGHGRVRITDFGLAIAAEDEEQAEEIAGTPAYMAPEQLAGKGATVRSDIYSLGLILYETYTGKKAFKAKTLAELREQKETQIPRAPSEIRQGIDPVVERVIQRCMEKDPNARPASVAQLAQALPGGDPLAAAIAAGETPSPEMVAASGSNEGLKPWIAWVCLIFTILSLGGMAVLFPRSILDKVPIQNHHEVMVQSARNILKDLGYTDTPVDSAFQFIAVEKYLDYVEKNDRSPNRFDKIPALTIQFAYRQSPKHLVKTDRFSDLFDDPPFRDNGESIVWLDSRGLLVGLRIIPPVEPVRADAVQPPNWSMLFDAAGLDEDDFDSAETESIPPVYDDIRAAWTGALPEFPDTAVRIEAAAWQGRPIFWRMIIPSWDNLSTADLAPHALEPGVGNNATSILLIFFLILVFSVCPVFFARRNLRMGRGDRRGAARLAGCILSLMAASWLFGEHHVASAIGEIILFISSAGTWLSIAIWLWLMYIALEPYARRRWPWMLISWSRLLAGNFRDPLVGRDLLIGIVTFAASIIPVGIRMFCHGMFGTLLPKPKIPTLTLFSGFPVIVARILDLTVISILLGLAFVFVVFILRVVLRKTWAVSVVLILQASVILYFTAPSTIEFILVLMGFTLALFACFRFGLVTIIAFFMCMLILNTFLISTQFSASHFRMGVVGMVLLLAFALYAFYTSLGGRPMFGTPRLDE